jgi:hypothetical protein
MFRENISRDKISGFKLGKEEWRCTKNTVDRNPKNQLTTSLMLKK